MRIKDDGEWIEFNVIIEKFTSKVVNVKISGKIIKDENGANLKERIDRFDREVLVPTNFLKSGISLVGRTPNHQYRIQKTKSTIYDTYSQKNYVVKHTVDEIKEALGRKNPVGFQIGRV